MFDPAKCLENARMLDPNAQLCDPSLCASASVQEMLEPFCDCQPPFPPQNPCPYGPDTPVTVFTSHTTVCFCCCGQVGARVAVDAGEARDLGDVWIGHMVNVARRGTD